MLIVISSPNAIENEASLINNLFDEGLTLFHLRKPDSSEEEIKQLMHQINSEHYSKIVFHQHHHLANVFGITRLHFTEMNRNNLSEKNKTDLKNNFTHLSTSIHSYKDYNNLSPYFDYAFLGPVFDSISKKNYKAIDIKKDLPNNENRITKLIALGGITKNNINEPITWGFDGAAVLGSIWENENPIKEFIQINNACNHCEITP
jgi:thiamine-phosphate pyrophosphorylase